MAADGKIENEEMRENWSFLAGYFVSGNLLGPLSILFALGYYQIKRFVVSAIVFSGKDDQCWLYWKIRGGSDNRAGQMALVLLLQMKEIGEEKTYG